MSFFVVMQFWTAEESIINLTDGLNSHASNVKVKTLDVKTIV